MPAPHPNQQGGTLAPNQIKKIGAPGTAPGVDEIAGSVLAQGTGTVVVVNPKRRLHFPLDMAEIAMQLGNARFRRRPPQQGLLPIPNLGCPLRHQQPGSLLCIHNL